MEASVPSLNMSATLATLQTLRSLGDTSSPRSTIPLSPRGSLRRSGLVTTSASLYTGPPPATTLRELAADSEFDALESRQRAIATRRVELLKRQAAISRESHTALTDPDGLCASTRQHVHDTQRVIADAQKRGIRPYFTSPPKAATLDAKNYLGAQAKALADIQAEITAGEAEEKSIVAALTALHTGAAMGRGRRADSVTNLASWRATYGSPSGALAATSPGYTSTWSPTPRYYGMSPPGSGPHGHKRKQPIFPSFASSAETLSLGRDIS